MNGMKKDQSMLNDIRDSYEAYETAGVLGIIATTLSN